jgi:hypothetical protein
MSSLSRFCKARKMCKNWNNRSIKKESDWSTKVFSRWKRDVRKTRCGRLSSCNLKTLWLSRHKKYVYWLLKKRAWILNFAEILILKIHYWHLIWRKAFWIFEFKLCIVFKSSLSNFNLSNGIWTQKEFTN